MKLISDTATYLPVDVREAARRAAELYNRYRAPEAEAEVVMVAGDLIVVVFRGPFCVTCGADDWVEDYKYVLEDLGAEAEILWVGGPVEGG